MRPPVYVRPLSDAERDQLEAGLRSSEAFTLRRCQILLASARGRTATAIASDLGCDDDTVRKAIRAFEAWGIAALHQRSRRPHETHAAFDPAGVAALRELVHEDPRACGYQTSLWTLALLATESARRRITDRAVTGETVRMTLVRAGIQWHRAKRWIRSSDPAYAPKKGDATD